MLSAAANAHAHQRILLHSLHFIYPFAVSARFCQMISGRPNENAIYIAKRERQGLQRQQRRACNRMTIKAQRLPWPLGPLQYAMTHLIYVAIMINERLIQIPVISMILNEHIAHRNGIYRQITRRTGWIRDFSGVRRHCAFSLQTWALFSMSRVCPIVIRNTLVAPRNPSRIIPLLSMLDTHVR